MAIPMRLHNVDTGAPRFLQMQAVYLFRAKLDPSQLENAFNRLLLLWPALRRRLNLIRTGTLPADCKTIQWEVKVYDVPLDAFIPLERLARDNLDEPETSAFEKMFKFGLPMKSRLWPYVFRIQVAYFHDGCALKFIAEHAFCDGEGFYRIISAFAALFRGETVNPVEERPLKFKFKESKRGLSLDSKEQLCRKLLQETREDWATSSSRFATWSVIQRLGRLFPGKQRSLRTLHIPGHVIDRFKQQAEAQEVDVSRSDLLMAMIAQATMKAFPGLSPARIGFMYNFRRHLEPTNALQNTFWPVSVRLPQPASKASQVETDILPLAARVRETVNTARHPRTLELFCEWFEVLGPGKPLHFLSLNPKRPQIEVSSSSHQSWQDIEFGSEKPFYIYPHVAVAHPYAILLPVVAGLLLTFRDKDRHGYLIHGSLHNSIWKQLEYFCE